MGKKSRYLHTTASLPVWQKLFGVDIEHLDQFMILQEANKVQEEEVDAYFSWFLRNVGQILNDNIPQWQDALKRQIRSYIATRRLIEQYGLDLWVLNVRENSVIIMLFNA